MTDLDETLSELEQDLHERDRLTHRLASTEERLSAARRRLDELREALRKEEADVERLEGLTLTALFHTLLSSKETQLEKERQEALKARLDHDTSAAAVRSAEAEVDELKRELEAYADLDGRVARAREVREAALRAADGPRGRELVELAARRAAVTAHANQLRGAQRCGISAYEGLQALEKALDGARDASNWDRFGGGGIATAVKRSRMDGARDLVDAVEDDLHRFEDELNALGKIEGFTLELERLNSLRFADHFFDGLVVDWTVHGRITRSLESTREAMEDVRDTVDHLDSEVAELRAHLERLTDRREEILRS